MSVASAFGKLLSALIKANYRSNRAFVRQVDLAQDESAASAHLSMVLRGLRPAPLDRIDPWADALGLAPGSPERTRFRRLALATHIPAEARPEMEALIGDLEQLHQRVLMLERRYPQDD